MKKHLEYFSERSSRRMFTVIIAVLLGSLVVLEALSAEQMQRMISTSELKSSIDALYPYRLYLYYLVLRGFLILTVVLVLAFLIANERGRFQKLQEEVKGTTKDLRHHAKRLKRSEEKYRSLVESADDIIYTADQYGNILSINRCFSKIIGQHAAEVIGKNIADVIQYKSSTDVLSIIARIVEESTILVREEQVTIGSKQYWLNTKYQAVGSDANVAPLILVIARDITEHKMIEQQLFQTEKLASLGKLSAGVAHEINNPIAVILGFSESLLDKFPEGSKEREIHEAIQRQGDKCRRIVENLLAFSRIPQDLGIETDVAENLQRVSGLVENTLVTKRIDFKRDMEDALPKVAADGRQLEQVFLNIINNAVASMKEGGTLTISAYRSNGGVSVAFADTGVGIPPEDLHRIFDPFFTTREVGEGRGLGLSVSYGIVKMFGGDITVRSRTEANGKARGTTFTVTLPTADGGKTGLKRGVT